MDNTDPNSFVFRLRGTIALLEAETQQGLEDWTPTITRLKEVLAEEEACSPEPALTASYSDAEELD